MGSYKPNAAVQESVFNTTIEKLIFNCIIYAIIHSIMDIKDKQDVLPRL